MIQKVVAGTTIHCMIGEIPIPPALGITGIHPEYARLRRTDTLSHSLKTVYAIAATVVSTATREKLLLANLALS